jgi:NDP-sugar pyrophosphorylase family protein
MKAVIQAGGVGARLKPYTLVLPKPLMPVGERPVLELLLRWLSRNGIREVFITIGHLGHLIRAVCGDGQQWGLDITYSAELEPLGTLGALNLFRDKLDSTFLVINGDVLTDLNLDRFTAFHQKCGSQLTVATATQNVSIGYGVIDVSGDHAIGFREKPSLTYSVSMGVYCMEPKIMNILPRAGPFGFDDLMFSMMERRLPVSTYDHVGLWLDIGRLEDFQKAQEWAAHTHDNAVLELAVA